LKIVIQKIYNNFVNLKSKEAVLYYKDDLTALTRYITWDLGERGNQALADSIGGGGEQLVKVFSLAIDRSLEGNNSNKKKEGNKIVRPTAMDIKSIRKNKARKLGKDDILSQWEDAAVINTDSELDSSTYESSPLTNTNNIENYNTIIAKNKEHKEEESDLLVNALQEVSLRTDTDKTSAVINCLVSHLSNKWRMNFAKSVAQKFNCFFLMTFHEEFNEYLRVELSKVYDGTTNLVIEDSVLSSLFDVSDMRRKLFLVERELEDDKERAILLKKKLERVIEKEKFLTNLNFNLNS